MSIGIDSKAFTLRDRVVGCWLGKAVGGTLGMPLEGQDGPFDLTFYEPVPTKMLPNDDLDLQVLWACVLDTMPTTGNGLRVDREVFADAWLKNVAFPWDEYGVAIRNLRAGIRPPLSGSFDNWFATSMGAAIRSELWACLAPGEPKLAAAYAYEDGCVDHAGEGVDAETFFAALQATAFVEHDVDTLLDVAVATLPSHSTIARAVSDTRAAWRDCGDWRIVRDQILREFGCENFTDVTMNVAFTILGWLAGDGDFGRSICIAVNCGKDTDCTGATVGALMGIIDPTCISDDWLKPIGRQLVVDHRITGIAPPDTIDGFADLVLSLRDRLGGASPPRAAPVMLPAKRHVANRVDIAVLPSEAAVDRLPVGLKYETLEVDGFWARFEKARFADRPIAVRYRFKVRADLDARVMFNTREPNVVWLDGEPLLANHGAAMGPSFHRVAVTQRTDLPMTAGEHELVAIVQPPATRDRFEWVWGVGRSSDAQWDLINFEAE